MQLLRVILWYAALLLVSPLIVVGYLAAASLAALHIGYEHFVSSIDAAEAAVDRRKNER